MIRHKSVCLFFICGLMVLTLIGVSQSAQDTAQISFPQIQLQQGDRILILAPHPDDEVLGCAGIIQKVLKMGLAVKVVFFTYGDNNQWSFIVYRKHPVVFSGAVKRMGLIRHDEALEAAKTLGLTPQQLVFLGYPDFGTLNIWYKHWNYRPAFKSMLTKARKVPYANAFHPGASYKGEEILNDLEVILEEFRPTKIFLSHPADHNGDHRALYLFTNVALWELKEGIKAELYPFLIHYKYWPKPRKRLPERKLFPPDLFKEEISWKINALTAEEIKLKEDALKKHRSQFKIAAVYLDSFIRANELFGDFSKVSLEDRFRSVYLSPNKKEDLLNIPEQLIDEERAAFVGIEEHRVAIENSHLAFSMKLSRRLGRGVGISVYLFGWRKDTPFAKMPKIHLRFGSFLHAIYDQSRRVSLENSGVKVKRSGRQITLYIPLSFLGSPERILTSANTYLGNVPLDWVSWRVLELPKNKTG